jgi:hypothetical protein
MEDTIPVKTYTYWKTFESLAPLGQELVDISDTDKAALLLEAEQIKQTRREDADALVVRLREISAKLASSFSPRDNALEQLAFRVVRPANTAARKISSYIIVSYCWHYPGWPLPTSAASISPAWNISSPMVSKILGLLNDDEGVWIDQLCINQNDNREKHVAIASMDTIYRSARRMVILLEDTQLDKSEEGAGKIYAEMYEDLCREVKERGLEGEEKADFIWSYFPSREAQMNEDVKADIAQAVHSFTTKMLGSRWYSRAWCAHEIRVSPHRRVNNPLFLCFGHDGKVLSFEFRFIFFLGRHVLDGLTDQAPLLNTFMRSITNPNPQTFQELYWRIQRVITDQAPDGGLSIHHLVALLSFGCTKSEDLLSIAMNTAGVPLIFKGNGESTEEVIWAFSILSIASGDITPLILDGAKLRMIDERGNNITSWVTQSLGALTEPRMLGSYLDTITAATKEYIELDLLVFTSLPLMATQSSMEKASRIIDKYGLEGIRSDLEVNKSESVRNMMDLIATEIRRALDDAPGPLATFLKIILAISIDCGIDWIRQFPIVMEKESVDSWMHGSIGNGHDARCEDAAIELLAMSDITRENVQRFDEEYLSPVVRFLTCVIDDRLRILTTMPRRLPARNGDSALTAATSNRSWIAVPVALSQLQIWNKRAWIIEPFSPTHETGLLEENNEPPLSTSDDIDRRQSWNEQGTWRLRRKQLLFGGQPIAADGTSVLLLKRQKVYGSEDYNWRNASMAAQNATALSNSIIS